MCGRIGAQLRAEEGIALVMALAVMFILSILVTSILLYAASDDRSAGYSSKATASSALAEAGINNALAVLANPSNNPGDPSLLPGTATTFSNGSVTWSGTFDEPSWKWTLTSTATVANPTGPSAAPIVKTIVASTNIYPNVSQTKSPGASFWDYLFAFGTGQTCDMTIDQSANVKVQTYVNGNLCMRSDAKITVGPLNVKGNYSYTGNNKVGSAASPISAAHLAGGCFGPIGSNPTQHTCTAADKIWAGTIDAIPNPSSLTQPSVDWDYWYRHASPGPMWPCTTATGTPPVFDNNTTRDTSAGTINLTASQSYTCQTSTGELSWNNSTKKLTIKGTVFIDGNVTSSGQGNAYYVGLGTIYASGTILISNEFLCGIYSSGQSCNATWVPTSNYLVLAANGGNSSTYGIKLDAALFQGAIYSAKGRVDLGQSSRVDGGMIAPAILLGQVIIAPNVPATIPAGLPGNTITSWVIQPPKYEIYN